MSVLHSLILLCVCAAHYLGPVDTQIAAPELLDVTHASVPARQCSKIKKERKNLLPSKNIPLSSVATAVIHVRRRGFYMQISKI